VDRRDIGSWLLGPKAALEQQGIDFGYPGKRLGMPEKGIGSIARMGRRLVALGIDWLASKLIVDAYFPSVTYGENKFGIYALAVFVTEVFFFTAIIGASFGQQILGIGIRKVSGAKLGVLPAALRTLLLALVVPPLIWDRDGRGLHDKLSQSVVVRTR
jgi:uncharacterized RDD family membrane protein YckC